eukprot:TRINITY_DN4371_c0_g1_i1.p1 TRINITY_DN4371_c0_g1~~TRINITY_DN4371_c0_g1_i1.p1  ORF type:complete len:253 (-),score=44.17 TRINITY_DN4371_c0_g1_i1:15-773(-)
MTETHNNNLDTIEIMDESILSEFQPPQGADNYLAQLENENKTLKASVTASTLEIYRLKRALALKEAAVPPVEEVERYSRAYHYASPYLGSISLQLDNFSMKVIAQNPDYKFQTQNKLELFSEGHAMTLSVYFLMSFVAGWLLLTLNGLLEWNWIKSLSLVMILNGALYCYACNIIHKYSSVTWQICLIFSGISFSLFIVGLIRFYLVLGSVFYSGVMYAYLNWKEKYPHLKTFPEVFNHIFKRQLSSVAHIN